MVGTCITISRNDYYNKKIGEKIKGIVGSKAPHGMPKEEKDKVINPIDLFIDFRCFL